jgi:type IV pilus assembly protein PilX
MVFNGSDGTYEVVETSNSVDPASASNYALTVDTSLLSYGGELLVNAAPQYYVERLPEIDLPGSDLTIGYQDQAPRVQYYRITGKGYGVSPNSEVILQSTFLR